MKIEPGCEVKCPTCGHWHVIYQKPIAPTQPESDRDLLYFTCRGEEYFAGALGTTGRLPSRKGDA